MPNNERELLKLTIKQREKFADRLLEADDGFDFNDDDAADKRCSKPRKSTAEYAMHKCATAKISDGWAVCQGCGSPRSRWSGRLCRSCYLSTLRRNREERVSAHFAWQARVEFFESLPKGRIQGAGTDGWERVAITEEDYQ